MAENVQHVDAASTPQSSSDASRVTQITPTVNKGFLGSLGEYFPHVNDLISSDGKKEIGFLAIVAWHHSIAKLAARQKIPFPPVLLSTIGALLGLTLVREIGGKESSDNLVEYFDPSVDFVGTWMSLWLVPSLVLLPNALRKIEGANKSMWVKLIITHFVLWCGSTVGSAKLYELLESRSTANSSEVNNSISAINSISISSPLVNGMQAGEDNKSPQVTSSESGPESIQGDNDNEISSSSSNGISPVATTNIESGGSVNGPSAAEKAQSEKTKKQLKLLRFWGAITVCFYAAPLHGIIATTAPALGGTTITALIAGKMMSEKVRKVLHPLLFATVISAIAAVLSDRLIHPGCGALEGVFTKQNKSWIESLYTYTSPSIPVVSSVICPPSSSSSSSLSFLPPISTDMRAGDYFALILGPACTALAFRIFSNSEKLHAKLPAILVASATAAVTSLVVSPLLGSIVGIPSELNNALAHRSISSALAVPSARMTGASPELTVAAVLLTGIYGASGQWILDRHNVTDEIASGVAFGAAAHSIGTASLLPSRPEAAAAASVALVTAGIAHAVVCSIPGVSDLINRFACKRG